jgi:hypothetical protein
VLLNKTTDNLNPECSDFRPISCLSLISFKLLEKMIANRLHLGKNKFAYGFLKQNSTDCMFEMFKQILNHCKNLAEENPGLFVASMYDFAKCFNTVNFLIVI